MAAQSVVEGKEGEAAVLAAAVRARAEEAVADGLEASREEEVVASKDEASPVVRLVVQAAGATVVAGS